MLNDAQEYDDARSPAELMEISRGMIADTEGCVYPIPFPCYRFRGFFCFLLLFCPPGFFNGGI